MKKPAIPSITSNVENMFPVLSAIKENLEVITGIRGGFLLEVGTDEIADADEVAASTQATTVGDSGLATTFGEQQTEVDLVIDDINTMAGEIKTEIDLVITGLNALNGIVQDINDAQVANTALLNSIVERLNAA